MEEYLMNEQEVISTLKRLSSELSNARSQLQVVNQKFQEQLQYIQENNEKIALENAVLNKEVEQLRNQLGKPQGDIFIRLGAWWKKHFGVSPELERTIQKLELDLQAQKELTMQAGSEAKPLLEKMALLQSENQTLAGRFDTAKSDFQIEVSKLKELLTSFENELEEKKALLSRYELENTRLNDQVSHVQETSQYSVLIDLIDQITPKRMAFLLENIGNLQLGANDELIKTAKRLCGYLNQLGLYSVYKVGERIKVKEEQLSAFLLDEKFNPDAQYDVISPGFKIKGNVIIKPKIQSSES
jgi:hypothetical protein